MGDTTCEERGSVEVQPNDEMKGGWEGRERFRDL